MHEHHASCLGFSLHDQSCLLLLLTLFRLGGFIQHVTPVHSTLHVPSRLGQSLGEEPIE
jgi:hypothetical protein